MKAIVKRDFEPGSTLMDEGNLRMKFVAETDADTVHLERLEDEWRTANHKREIGISAVTRRKGRIKSLEVILVGALEFVPEEFQVQPAKR